MCTQNHLDARGAFEKVSMPISFIEIEMFAIFLRNNTKPAKNVDTVGQETTVENDEFLKLQRDFALYRKVSLFSFFNTQIHVQNWLNVF